MYKLEAGRTYMYEGLDGASGIHYSLTVKPIIHLI